METPQKRKISHYIPPAMIVATVILVYFQGLWFYESAILTMIVVMFLFFRSLQKIVPPLSRNALLLPLVSLIGIFGTAAASPLAGVFFGLVGAYLLYYYYRAFPKDVPIFIAQTMTLFAAFMFAAFIWSLNYFFTPPPWVVMILSGAGFFALLWPYLHTLGTWVGTTVMVEFTWVLLFWPVHFFTQAVASLAVFYLMFMLSYLRSIGKLTRPKIYFQVSLISFIVIIALLSSAWEPISGV